jgi:hypothetical protein
MKNAIGVVCITAVLLLGFTAPAFAGSWNEGGYSPEMQAKIGEVKKELKNILMIRQT